MDKESPDRFDQIHEMIRQNDSNILASEWAREAVQGLPTQRLKLEDEIPFDGTRCLTHCGGKCCTDTQVSIKPYDIYRIVTSSQGCDLGLFDTTKLFHGSHAPLECYLGNISGIPQACIRFRELPLGTRVCPFLMPVRARSKRELRQLIQAPIKSRTVDGFPVLLCRLHKVKPLICRAAPIARSQFLGTEKLEVAYYFHPPMKECACVQTEKASRWQIIFGRGSWISTTRRMRSFIKS